jgi:WD40 repeat protein
VESETKFSGGRFVKQHLTHFKEFKYSIVKYIAPDRLIFGSSTSGWLEVWENAYPKWKLIRKRRSQSISFIESLNESHIACGSFTSSVFIWDISADDETPLAILKGHATAVSCGACISRTDCLLVTSSFDGNILLWQWKSQSLLRNIRLDSNMSTINTLLWNDEQLVVATESAICYFDDDLNLQSVTDLDVKDRIKKTVLSETDVLSISIHRLFYFPLGASEDVVSMNLKIIKDVTFYDDRFLVLTLSKLYLMKYERKMLIVQFEKDLTIENAEHLIVDSQFVMVMNSSGISETFTINGIY